MKAADAANEAKSRFLANMSHEIRTPLGAIIGFMDLIKNSQASEAERTSYLSVVERNAAQVLRLVDDILDLSKVEAGKIVLENIRFSLIDFLNDFASLMKFQAKENGISFDIISKTKLPEFIFSDPTRLRQILTNIVGNALKFTSEGSVTVEISFEPSNILIFRITDTGRGISEEQAQDLFHPFVQADSSTTRKFGGTGLGLSLTRGLCELMGGEFRLENSVLDAGSEFLASVKVSVPADSRQFDFSDNDFIETKNKEAKKGLFCAGPIARFASIGC